MDFQNLKRKELQALCKKHNIPANLSNLNMANRLAAIFKPSVQDLDEIETESDSNNVLSNRKSKKVRFSPDNEVFEFTRSAGNKRIRKNSRLVVDGGKVTRSRGQDLVEVSVKEKKRGKNAAIRNSDTNSLLTTENCDNRAVTRRSTRNSGVVGKGNSNAGLGMNEREEVWKENKISEEAVIVSKPQILLGVSILKPCDNYVNREKVMDQDEIADEKAFVEPQVMVRRSTRKSDNNCEGKDIAKVDKKIIEGNVIVEPQRRSKRKFKEESDEVLKKKELAEKKVTVEPQILPRRSTRKGINNYEESDKADFCEEAVKDKKTAVAKVIVEPRGRPKRKVNMIDDSEILIGDAKKQENVEIRGLRKPRKSKSFKGSGVDSKDTEDKAKTGGEVEVITQIQENMKAELRRNRRKSVMPGNESLGNDDRNKLSSSVLQEDSTKGVSEGENVCQPGGVLRRSGRNTLKLEVVSVIENLDTDAAVKKIETTKVSNGPGIVKKEISAVQRNIGTSQRKASKYTSPKISAEFSGDTVNQLENEEMNIENNACLRKDVLNDDSDPLELSLTKSSIIESKVQGKKLSCNLSGSSLSEASSQESLMAIEESLSAQMSVTTLSMSRTKTDKDTRLKSSTESARNIRDSSIADGVMNVDTESINGIPLANFDETNTFKTSGLLISSVDNIQLSLDADVQEFVEQTTCVTQKIEVAAPVLSQIEDASCINITNNNGLPLAFNVSEKVGIVGTSSVADILTHFDQTDFEADMKVTEDEVEKCAQLCLDSVNLVGQVKGVSFQENVNPTEPQCITEIALPIQCHLDDLDLSEASKESSEKTDENCALEAGEVSASKPSGSVVSALKEAGVAETTENIEAEDVQSKISCDNMSLDNKSEESLYKITDKPDEQPKTTLDIAKQFPLKESYSHGSKTTLDALSISKTSHRRGEITHQTIEKFITDWNEPIKIEISSKVDEFSVLERDLESREGVYKMKEVEIQNQSLEKVGESGNELVNGSPGNSILPKSEGAIGEGLNFAINDELKKNNSSLILPVDMDALIEVYGEEKCAGMSCSRLIGTSMINSQGQSILDEEAKDSGTEVRCHDKSLDTDWSKNLTDENGRHVKVDGNIAQTNEAAVCVSATGIGMCPVPTNFEDSNSVIETFNEVFGGHLSDEVAKAVSIGSEIDAVMMDKAGTMNDTICNVESEKPIEPKLQDMEEIENLCQEHIMCDEGEQLSDEESGHSLQENVFGNLIGTPEENINSCRPSETTSPVAKIPSIVTSFDEQDCSLTEKKKHGADGVSGSERKFGSTYCGKVEGKLAQTNEAAVCVSATGIGMSPVHTIFEDSNSLRETINEVFGGHLHDEVAKAGSIGSEIDVVMMDKDENTEKKYVQILDAAGSMIDAICNVEAEKPLALKLLDIEEIENPCQKHIMCDEGQQLSDEESGQSLQENVFGNFFGTPEQNINSSGPSETSSHVAKIPSLVTSFNEQDCSLTAKKKHGTDGVSGTERKFETTYCGKVEGRIAQTNEAAVCVSASGIGMSPVPTMSEDRNSVRDTFNEAFWGHLNDEVSKGCSIGSEIDVVMMDKDESMEKKYVQTVDAAGSMNDAICNVESENPIEPKLLDIEEIENPCQEHIMCDGGEQLSDEESGQSSQENVFGNLFGTQEQNINSSGPSEASSRVAKIPSIVTSFNEQDCSLTEKKQETDGVSGSERKSESTYCIDSVPSIKKDALIQSTCHEEVEEAGNELVNTHTVSLPISVLTDRKGPSEEYLNLVKNVEVVNFSTCPIAPMDKYVPSEDSQYTCADMRFSRMKETGSMSAETVYSQGQSIIDEEAKDSDSEVRCHDKSLDTDLSEKLKYDEGEQLPDEESDQSLQENELDNFLGTPEQNINLSGPNEASSRVTKIPSLLTSFNKQDCSLSEKKHEIIGVSGSEFKMDSTNCTKCVPSIKIDSLIQPKCHEEVEEAENELVNTYTVSPAISVLADRKGPSVEDLYLVKDVEVVNFPTEASQENCAEITYEDATASDSEVDLLKLATTEKKNCFTANCEDSNNVEESFVDAFEEPLNSEVGKVACIDGEILIMDKGTLCSLFTEEETCEMKSNDADSYDANCLDDIDDIPRFSHEMNDELHINIQADMLASNGEKQSTVKESKEAGFTFQNATEDRSTFLHVESELFTGLEMQLFGGEHDNTDAGNSETEPSAFYLEDDMKHCRDGESNSAQRLELHLQEKVEDFSNDSLAVSDLPSSQCDEILKESDVMDTIKEYINSEFSLSMDFHDSGCANLPFEVSTHMEEGDNNDNAASSKTQETEGCAASNLASGKVIDTEDGQIDTSRLFSTAKKNARTILIHGTPGKSLKMADMKENAPNSKTSQRGDFTTARPAKRKALQDVRWK